MVYSPVRGENPRSKAGGLSPVQMKKQCYHYFMTPISVDLAYKEIFTLKICIFLQW